MKQLDINSESTPKEMAHLIQEIHSRGNDVEIRECKGEIKIFEVSRKLISTIKK